MCINFTSVLNTMLHPGQAPLTWPKHHNHILETCVRKQHVQPPQPCPQGCVLGPVLFKLLPWLSSSNVESVYGEDIKRLEIECRDHRPLEVTAQTRCPQQPLSGAWRTLSSSECRSGIRTAQESQDGAVFPEEDSPPRQHAQDLLQRCIWEPLDVVHLSGVL